MSESERNLLEEAKAALRERAAKEMANSSEADTAKKFIAAPKPTQLVWNPNNTISNTATTSTGDLLKQSMDRLLQSMTAANTSITTTISPPTPTEQKPEPYIPDPYIVVTDVEKVTGYLCEKCDEYYRWDQFRSTTVWFCGDANMDIQYECDCGSIYVDSEPEAEDAWFCEADCFHHDEGKQPEKLIFYRCVNDGVVSTCCPQCVVDECECETHNPDEDEED